MAKSFDAVTASHRLPISTMILQELVAVLMGGADMKS
jgi:hypothetical protein